MNAKSTLQNEQSSSAKWTFLPSGYLVDLMIQHSISAANRSRDLNISLSNSSALNSADY